MNAYCHHVSGFFAHRDEAEGALSRLVDKGLPYGQMQIFSADATATSLAQEEKSDAVLQEMLVDGAIGAAVGTGVGTLGTVALTAASVTLFIANPLVAPLMMIGWGASIGGLIGATAGVTGDAAADSKKKEGWLSDLVRDAIASGQVVLVAEAGNEQETAIAREVIKDSVAKHKDAKEYGDGQCAGINH